MRHRIAPVALVALLIVGCGGGSFVDKADKTLATSLAATNGARDEFLRWDALHQLELVDAATTEVEAEAALATYRKKRAPVVKAFTIAYSAIAAAAAILPLVEKGTKPERDLVKLLSDAVMAALAVKAVVEAVLE